MKKLSFLLWLLIITMVVSAQGDTVNAAKKHGIQKFGSIEEYRKKKYLAIDEIGGMFGFNGYAKGKYFFSYHTVNAFQFDPQAYAGIGAGFEMGGKNSVLINEGNSNMAVMVPLFVEIRATLTRKKVAPVVSQKVGYTFYLAGPKPAKKIVGGGFSQTQIGFKAFISKCATFNFTVGYRMQTIGVSAAYAGQFDDMVGLQPSETSEDVSKVQKYWHFLTVHAGFTY